ncbi:MAG: hypothetical protein QOJ84_3575 [Bradyrhizobium sp.]|nr:hypothetical protein [Bradyrhizobium sp.]
MLLAPQPKGARGTVKALIRNVKRAICRSLVRNAVLLIFAGAALLIAPIASAQTGAGIEQRFATSLTALPSEKLGVTGSFYVPAYSSVSLSEGRLRADFSVTLNIHNASETRPLVLRRIAYFDTNGKPVQSYLKEPVALKPFATIEVFIPTTDVRGGTGANFIVDWAADGPIAEPVIEALMLGGLGAGQYAFISQGRPVKIVGGN